MSEFMGSHSSDRQGPNMAERVCVIGGFGQIVTETLAAYAEAGRPVEVVGVVDDGPTDLNLARLAEHEVAYLGTLDSWLSYGDYEIPFVLGVEDPHVRGELAAQLESVGLRPFRVRPVAGPLSTGLPVAS